MRRYPWKGRGRLCRDCGGREDSNATCPRCWENAEQEHDERVESLINQGRETAKQLRSESHDPTQVPVGPLGYSVLLDALAGALEDYRALAALAGKGGA